MENQTFLMGKGNNNGTIVVNDKKKVSGLVETPSLIL